MFIALFLCYLDGILIHPTCGFLFYNLYDSYQYILGDKTDFGSSCNIISLLLILYHFMKYRVISCMKYTGNMLFHNT